jgi:excinuclease ABC subunit C
MKEEKKKLYENFPEVPGVYIMKDISGEILYVGKAGNLKKRVSSYFYKSHNRRIEKLVQEIKEIEYLETDSVLEALILEAELIKKYEPLYNIKDKDDKSFLFVEISNDDLPQVRLVRGKSNIEGERFGPYTNASDLRKAMRILRKIFPYSIHSPKKYGSYKRPCLDYEIGLCPGTCNGSVDKKRYKKNVNGLKQVLRGKKKNLVEKLKKEMKKLSDNQNFEEAASLKKQIFALEHINDTALISESQLGGVGNPQVGGRIEGYDISNISGTSAVGSMVVFEGGRPKKSDYRKFKIRTIRKQDDTGMMKETLRRRLKHEEWPLPDLVLIDGGKGQVNAALEVFSENGISVPIVGIAKGPERKKNDFVGKIPEGFNKEVLIKVRDEAHRFAIEYHRKLRKKRSLEE